MSPVEIARMDTRDPDFWARLRSLVEWDDAAAAVEETVRAILADVRTRGDAAIVEYTNRFDRRAVSGVHELMVPPERLSRAERSLPKPLREALTTAAARIRAFHQQQKESSWFYREDAPHQRLEAPPPACGAPGVMLGQRITPLERVGLYVPGGKAAYPSSVLMNAIPAQVAGVPDIVMAVPAPGGEMNDAVLAAAALVGIDRVYTVGGAQAVAALAYGTDSFAAVDKIVGPGNAYVATAKRLVFGQVGIDMVAGPSEIVVVGDGSTPPDWVAADLFSQAEHDEDARAVLVTDDAAYLEAVSKALGRRLPDMARRTTIARSLSRHGALVKARDIEEAMEIVNFIAPEHLELSVADPEALLPSVRNAGAVFLGRYASEVLGDYCAGPNHVLPTGRTARFSSPLGVYDFQKRTSVIRCSSESAGELGRVAAVLARAEGLDAHARAAEARIGAAARGDGDGEEGAA